MHSKTINFLETKRKEDLEAVEGIRKEGKKSHEKRIIKDFKPWIGKAN